MGLGKLLGFGKTNKNQTTNPFYETIYPESVRYALSYKEAQMGKAEIAALIDRFTHEAMYLTIKSMRSPEVKREYIEDLTRIFINPDYTLDDLKAYLRKRVQQLPDDATANGAKLAQLNRSGSTNWQDSFRELAEKCFEEDPNALPCLIAHTIMLGYHHFVKAYSQLSTARITILVPEWMIDPNNDLMGYEVILGPNMRVNLQPKDECLVGAWVCMKTECRFANRFCGNTFFIDDTISTGTTASKVTSFWHSEYGHNVPEERVRVITDLRGQTMLKQK